MKKMVDSVVAVVVVIGFGALFAAAFYACEVVPMDECMSQGHSLAYCHKLLNK